MSEPVLVAYATKRGSTREVAEAIAGWLRELGVDAEARPAADVRSPAPYRAVVLGGALYMGRWHADARRFLSDHRAALSALPLAVFALGPKTVEDADVAASRKQLDAALAKAPGVMPVSVAVFGGVIDPAKLRFPFNHMPTSDARDWHAIRRWTTELAGRLEARTAA